MAAIVTKESLVAMLSNSNTAYVDRVIGRALVALFNRQTTEEQVMNSTTNNNAVGFTGSDAHTGSITAKYFLKHKALLQWQRDMWLKPNVNGTPRIAKYWKQLNEIANANKGA